MGQYQKFMFDNFVISCDEEECFVEDVVEPQIVEVEEIIDNDIEFDGEIVDVEDEVVVEKNVPIPAIVYSIDEFNAAVKQAEEKGYERGFRASSGEAEILQQELLNSINSRLMGLIADSSKIQEQVEQSSLQLLKEIIVKVMPSLEREYALAEIQKFLGDSFPNFRHENSLTFTFNPQIIKNVQEIVGRLANINDYEGKISIHKDASLEASDCRVEWKNGGVERNTHKMLEKIDNLLDDETID